MPFQVSPGVNVSEIDLTTVVPAVATTEGGLVGEFRWGPAGTRVLLDSEDRLVNIFQKPNTNTAEDFFTAANFLSYGNALYVVRETPTGALNSAQVLADAALYKQGADSTDWPAIAPSGGSFFFGKYAGALGNSLRVSVCRDSVDYSSSTGTFEYTIARNSDQLKLLNTSVGAVISDLSVGDIVELGAEKQRIKIKTIATATSDLDDDAASDDVLVTLEAKYKGDDVTTVGAAAAIVRHWEFSDVFDTAPGTSAYALANGSANDEIHVVVVDAGGEFSGTAGSILETYNGLSLASDAKTEQGAGNFWFNVLNTQSQYIAAFDGAIFTNAGTTVSESVTAAFGGTGDTTISTLARGVRLSGGKDATDSATTLTAAQKITGYDLFKNAEDVDVSFLLGGNADQTLALKLIDIAESRKDCLAVLSPEKLDVVNAGINTRDNVIEFRDSLSSTSYAVMDSGWKYQYDKYNDVYRWVPLNADTAGLMVQTDLTRDPWYSPAGYNRGNMKNVVKLAYNPGKGDRDQLYKKGINPVVTQPGQGTVLFGDKTLLSKPSAFDRINVRRLFIVLEKAIATAAKFTLFEFNDEFTRSQFTNLVVPFLRDVQGRRGITDFQVVCDGSNNTGEVIDRNEFIGDIYIKPARSINFIQLNFVAVRSGVEFSEVVGRV